ncbi:MAG TPA: YnbE family lipoprotein [Desulfurivibrionaceae bacterium]|nr:YnbE family lipoprotein [Desulfurivibrionaceae bacterium]
MKAQRRTSVGAARLRQGGLLVAVALLLSACTPTVQMAAPKEPITVNLNVKIQHEIYVKVDKEVDELFDEQGLF